MNHSKKAVVQKSIGMIFLVAGTGKLLLPLAGGAIPTFQLVLEAIGLPQPALMALAICLMEVTGGIALIKNRYRKSASLVLGSILLGALTTFSIPSTLSTPLVVQGLELGREFFRIPLEGGLLCALVWINRKIDLVSYSEWKIGWLRLISDTGRPSLFQSRQTNPCRTTCGSNSQPAVE